MNTSYPLPQYAQRHPLTSQQIDSSRQPYSGFPPPPPPSIVAGSPLQGIPLPPPPPRRYPSQVQASILPPPPPPAAPPGSAGLRQASWTRSQNYYSTTPSMGLATAQPAPYNPNAYYNYQQDNQPLTSANYIPSGESFGPGVGIPPLIQGSGGLPNFAPPRQTQETNSSSHRPSDVGINDDLSQLHALPSWPSMYMSSVDSISQPDTTLLTSGTSDPTALNWPPERVTSWLAANNFSSDWQETFKKLNLNGATFLEIVGGHGGKGNLNLMHTKIFPQLAQESTKSGTGWDQAREREEARRLRKLIRSQIELDARDQNSSQQHIADEHAPNDRTWKSTHFDPGGLGSFALGDDEGSPSLSDPPMMHSPSALPRSQVNQLPWPSQSSPRFKQTGNPVAEALNSVGPSTRAGQSPISSRDIQVDNTEPKAYSHDSSPHLSPAIQQTISTPSSSQSSLINPAQQRYFGHNRVRSNDRQAPQSIGIWNEHDPKVIQEAQRPPSREQGNRNATIDATSGTKESRGILKTLKGFTRPSKREDNYQSLEDTSNSPSSPVIALAPTTKLNSGSDTHLENSSVKVDFPYDRRTHRQSPINGLAEGQRYCLVTSDARNYRLLNVSGIDSVAQFFILLRSELSLSQHNVCTIFATRAGQNEHEVALSDAQILLSLQGTDDVATVKFFVQVQEGVTSISDGVNTGQNSHSKHEKEMDAQSIDSFRTAQSHSERGVLVDKTIASSQQMSSPATTKEDHTVSRLDHGATNEDHKSLSDRRQRTLTSDRKIKPKKESPVESGSPGPIRGDRVIDFDRPRESPFESTFSETLVPHRKAPPVPKDTTTLIKANSLSKKNVVSPQHPWLDQTSTATNAKLLEDQTHSNSSRSRRRAIADSPSMLPEGLSFGAGRTSGIAGTPTAGSNSANLTNKAVLPDQERKLKDPPRSIASVDLNGFASGRSSPGSPRSPGFTMSRGGLPFKIPEYDEQIATPEEPVRQPVALPHRILTKLKEMPMGNPHSSPDVSPATQHAPLLRSGTKRGPTIDFQEPPVSFEKRPALAMQDSGDDSDDGLFAVPIASIKSEIDNAMNQKRASPLDNTKSGWRAASDGVTQVMREPQATESAPDFASTTFSPLSSTDDHEGTIRGPSATDTVLRRRRPSESADMELRAARRQSFISDGWAPRPPPETLVENLDAFFPNVDLDQPMPDEVRASTNTITPLNHDSDVFESATAWNPASNGISELASPQGSANIMSLAQRHTRKLGGLGRTKSIRDVVKGAYQQPASQVNFVHSRVNTLKTSDIVRRRSTKMFGAKIEQIKPARGSRLIQLGTVPQNVVAQDTIDTIPQRQRTFKWVKGQLIGKGSFGRVYLGMNTTTGELLAVKQVAVNPKQVGQDKDKIKELMKSLDSEIDTMQNLEHVNIVQYLGCERNECSISIFLEYISGGSIGSCLRKHGKFEESVVSSLTRQTLNGLEYLHKAHILHRDLKADNILLDIDGTCKISDFGISKKSENIYRNDITNSMEGSVFWMAPEVVRSQGKGYSAKVDIWSLGCVVLEMFAGKRPWSKEEAIGAIYKLGSLNEAPPIPEDVSDAISPAALSFMYDCFNIDPTDRPTAERLLQAPFCYTNPAFNFLDTELYAKINPHS